MKKLFISATLAGFAAIGSATAQEVCISDANKSVSEWTQTNSTTLMDLWAKHDAAANPANVVVNYEGEVITLFYALEKETIRYKAGRAAAQDAAIKRAEDCAGKVAIPRQAWDFFRATTFPGVPEEKLRIDFAEWQKGNIAGGDKSAVREFGRKADEILNPFRWKF